MSGHTVIPALAGVANARLATYGRSVAPTSATGIGTTMVPVANGVPGATCAGYKDDGTFCGARPAKGTDLCVGHLRKEGRL